jgi:hypothetical protein
MRRKRAEDIRMAAAGAEMTELDRRFRPMSS